jgi:hypothetical protein
MNPQEPVIPDPPGPYQDPTGPVNDPLDPDQPSEYGAAHRRRRPAAMTAPHPPVASTAPRPRSVMLSLSKHEPSSVMLSLSKHR